MKQQKTKHDRDVPSQRTVGDVCLAEDVKEDVSQMRFCFTRLKTCSSKFWCGFFLFGAGLSLNCQNFSQNDC